ncbi:MULTISPECIES: UDP-glucose 4-epimerase GalE [Thalassospira]|uniref:UDP-glucose 4-epimerase n=1 Tax=Thalassospira indica TaxID=1891279 RepID=A0ABM6XTT0_9PROT|nr:MULTISPECIES: UDP-glucose 4-epimerase GalE [Thalassospira]OAZ15330.1 UDP-glucose 4-epimerase [Thalassospira profundimaris]BDW87263.1 UDP-glucose 4-epimerase GalE [Thalassospira tepidiphila]AXO12835.1 UDP-glucose 4-epimerase GalE [Thalassospira indica]EKF10376.1 UDP-galactose 4-epimerase [Thalassospira profundimaris WP0211]MBO6580187.1 UDP-glucose 4-epimerase GalE [Thalassospira sp.]|tara:strand:+ start:1699 stop:2694 length:996 start_codon:yes stop_codon:yes gene_type:complete
MTVLVTGGAGYIGSHAALALLDGGRDVVVLDNLSQGHRWAVPTGAAFVEGDCGDEDLVRRVIAEHDVTAIMHFAGSIIVPDSVIYPLEYYRNNTVNSRALLQVAVDSGVKHFIFSSTAGVYGEPKATPINEDFALKPISPYGTSKMMTEKMLADAAIAHDLRYVALRYFNVAGADPKGRSGQTSRKATHLIKIASQAATGTRPQMAIYGEDYETPDGTCIRDYIHVSDLANAHVLALEYLERGGESDVMNCGYGRGFSVREVIGAVKKVSGVDFEVELADRRPGDPAALIAAADRIRQKLGWTPVHDDLEDIVRHALDWEQSLKSREVSAA